MLLLCSDGLTGVSIAEELQKHTKECKTAAVVVTADNEYKENNYHVPERREELLCMGLTVETFDIDTSDAELLLSYDMVEFIGGNPFYLLDSIRKHSAEPVLRALAEQKILIAISAAAFAVGPSLELVNEYTPEQNIVSMTDLTGLSLTETEVLPHYSRFAKRFDRFEERCREYEQRRGTNVIRLNDGDGVFLFGDRQLIVRNESKSTVRACNLGIF